MDTVAFDTGPERQPLYNSELETGTRAMVILDAAYPRALDLATLTWFDHLVVHTKDIGGPPSLHPALPGRTGELLVRRRLVEDSLALMRRLHLVETVADENGLAYRASDDVPALVGLLRTRYATALKNRARWLIAELGDLDQAELTARLADRIGRWAVEFQGEGGHPGQTE
jgi:hypothetical protein